jgi:hypothetical protein
MGPKGNDLAVPRVLARAGAKVTAPTPKTGVAHQWTNTLMLLPPPRPDHWQDACCATVRVSGLGGVRDARCPGCPIVVKSWTAGGMRVSVTMNDRRTALEPTSRSCPPVPEQHFFRVPHRPGASEQSTVSEAATSRAAAQWWRRVGRRHATAGRRRRPSHRDRSGCLTAAFTITRTTTAGGGAEAGSDYAPGSIQVGRRRAGRRQRQAARLVRYGFG